MRFEEVIGRSPRLAGELHYLRYTVTKDGGMPQMWRKAGNSENLKREITVQTTD